MKGINNIKINRIFFALSPDFVFEEVSPRKLAILRCNRPVDFRRQESGGVQVGAGVRITGTDAKGGVL